MNIIPPEGAWVMVKDTKAIGVVKKVEANVLFNPDRRRSAPMLYVQLSLLAKEAGDCNWYELPELELICGGQDCDSE